MIAQALYSGPVRTIDNPKDIPALIDPTHPGYSLVCRLTKHHPRSVSRDVLRQATGTAGNEPRLAAAFEWRILRANDSLPYLGWRIATTKETYRLEKIDGCTDEGT